MLELSSSTMAWISLVVVQAFIHYFMIGARRERINKETEAMIIEESLSYSGESIESDMNYPNTPTGEPTAITTKYETVPSSPSIQELSINMSDPDAPMMPPFYLTQTGTEVIEVCGGECLSWSHSYVYRISLLNSTLLV